MWELLKTKFGEEKGEYLQKNYQQYFDQGEFGDLDLEDSTDYEEALFLIEDIVKYVCNTTLINYRDLPPSFQQNNPEMFLPSDAPEELKTKFYNRTLTITDLVNQPRVLAYFANVDIAYGLGYNWAIGLFGDNLENKIKLLTLYSQLEPFKQPIWANYLNEYEDTPIAVITNFYQALQLARKDELEYPGVINMLSNSHHPWETYKVIHNLFTTNNLPLFLQKFLLFKLKYPDYSMINNNYMVVSPVLKKANDQKRDKIILNDLFQAEVMSGSKSLKEYLLKNHDINTFYELVNWLPENIKNPLNKETIVKMMLEPNFKEQLWQKYALGNFKTKEEILNYMELIQEKENRRHQELSTNIVINSEDFIKGINGLKTLEQIIKTGILAKDYVGKMPDNTPLDTDLAVIDNVGTTLYQTVLNSGASDFGSIWLIIKNDDRFWLTRTSDFQEKIDDAYNQKLEVFASASYNTVGVRTGFPSTVIDYIVVKDYDEKIGGILKDAGIYIPVIDQNNNLVFSYEDFLTINKCK